MHRQGQRARRALPAAETEAAILPAASSKEAAEYLKNNTPRARGVLYSCELLLDRGHDLGEHGRVLAGELRQHFPVKGDVRLLQPMYELAVA